MKKIDDKTKINYSDAGLASGFRKRQHALRLLLNALDQLAGSGQKIEIPCKSFYDEKINMYELRGMFNEFVSSGYMKSFEPGRTLYVITGAEPGKISKEYARLSEICKTFDEYKELDEDILYESRYNPLQRKVTLNNIILSKKNSFSPNDTLAEYIFRKENQNRVLTMDELRKQDSEIPKNIHKRINDLGYKGLLKNIFFEVSQKGLLFSNPITRGMLKKMNLDELSISSLLHNND